ncbi:MAG: radical SAM protein [Chitinispirillales bacterium]|jgi:radical SAM superfamily enzyme YgiQ (UPF0313 family)|nr:radical SAM protein [Chitinispirillales bacterium]
MQKMLFVTFDLTRPHDPQKSLAVASILATLKGDERLKFKYKFEHLSINVFTGEDWREKVRPFRLSEYSYIAISAYVWSEHYIDGFLAYLRANGFSGKIILGGYQIAGDTQESYKARYPLADIFIEGSAELKLLELLMGEPCSLREMSLPSVYLTGEIEITQDMQMIRLETKRGCPYACSFCRHKGSVGDKIIEFDKNRVMEELRLAFSKGVKKINIIDPIFHVGKNYMDYLSEIISLCESKKADTIVSLQCRLEFLASRKGRKFLELCKKGKFELEFGLQTCDERESILINRKNDFRRIKKALKMLNKAGITHEISLIYGLPGQTLSSFSKGVKFLKRRSKAKIVAYPLMLLRGTQLFEEKEEYSFKEEEGEFGIPHVVESSSFTRDDWLKMKEIASATASNHPKTRILYLRSLFTPIAPKIPAIPHRSVGYLEKLQRQ